jgi:hypothetical protein
VQPPPDPNARVTAGPSPDDARKAKVAMAYLADLLDLAKERGIPVWFARMPERSDAPDAGPHPAQVAQQAVIDQLIADHGATSIDLPVLPMGAFLDDRHVNGYGVNVISKALGEGLKAALPTPTEEEIAADEEVDPVTVDLPRAADPTAGAAGLGVAPGTPGPTAPATTASVPAPPDPTLEGTPAGPPLPADGVLPPGPPSANTGPPAVTPAPGAPAAATPPVVAPVGVGADGQTYNINADTVAGAIAGALGAERLLVLTDVAGVKGPDGHFIAEMTVAQVKAGIAEGWINAGMIPKVETCIYAIEQGVKGAVILDGRVPHAVLRELFTDGGAGTLIKP